MVPDALKRGRRPPGDGWSEIGMTGACLAVSASVQQASSLRTQDVRACRLISRDGLARAAVGGTARQGEKVVHGMAYDQRAVLIGPTRRQARGAAVGWLNALAGAERARPIAGPAVTESVPQ